VVGSKHLGEGKVEIKERRSGKIHLAGLEQVGRAMDDLLRQPSGGRGESHR
jgi:hypothetical protein